jgi:hypothetical protein
MNSPILLPLLVARQVYPAGLILCVMCPPYSAAGYPARASHTRPNPLFRAIKAIRHELPLKVNVIFRQIISFLRHGPGREMTSLPGQTASKKCDIIVKLLYYLNLKQNSAWPGGSFC